MPVFPSDEWVQELKGKVNQSLAYAEAAKTWEGDFYFVVEPDAGTTEPVVLYMDLWHGQCRDAFAVQDPAARKPAYRIAGPLAVWKRVVMGELEPIPALLTRQLRLNGNMVQIMKSIRAAQELIHCCVQVPTEFSA